MQPVTGAKLLNVSSSLILSACFATPLSSSFPAPSFPYPSRECMHHYNHIDVTLTL